ncbi:hypothetical protein MTF65_06135 [Streptomyces sp. APSN-46.1]|uniref:hypothetical protein n=1 Tax=Streptomyces sp. APSN-46.1 TaxID=2929049 RepID=UPI001FB22458|nr:hypothetical protein [Streptomyces sp. APSN-46.1]MCJ1676930.1 hypothetical protein [Streptomyces sp. APSN-46.1]
MSETEPERPLATLELLTLLAAGAADPAPDPLGRSARRAQEPPHACDPRGLLTEGVVELRKRGELAAGRAGAGPEPEDVSYPQSMARRAAERAGRPRAGG